MRENRLRVLATEGDPDRVQLLEEAFTEMEELRFTRPAYPVCSRDYALDWREAMGIMAESPAPPDAILLNISHDCPLALVAFHALRSAAPGAAIVLICAQEDETLALSLVRQGAQDYLIETAIDCDPLARSLRGAVERSRLAFARQSVSLLDDLTGLYNQRGMTLQDGRDERVASSLDLRRWSVQVRLDHAAEDHAPDRDLRRIELAEQLIELTAHGAVAGREAEDEFTLLGLAASGAAAEALAREAGERLKDWCIRRGVHAAVQCAGAPSLATATSP